MSRRAPVAVREGFVLRVRRPSGAEEVVGLAGASVTIGRQESNAVVLPDACVSRTHARIDCGADRYMITDCGSKNGTFVNERRVQAQVLHEGDVVRIGDTELRFESAQAEVRVDTQTTGLPVAEPEAYFARADAAPEAADPAGATGLEALARISDLLAAADGELTVLETVARHLRAVVACDRATVILTEEGSGNPLMQFSHSVLEDGEEGPADQVIRAGLTAEKPVRLNVPKASGVLDATLGIRRHVLLVPLQGDERKLGLLILERVPSQAPFDTAELHLASIAGSHLATFLRFVA